MNTLVNAVTSFFTYAILAIGAQNVILTRGLGLSNGLRMISDPRKDTIYFCLALTFFQLVNSVMAYFAVPLVYKTPLAPYARFLTPVIIVVCCAVSYIVTVTIISAIIEKSLFKKLIYSFTSASINSAIVGTIILSLSQGFDFVETIGFAFGSSVGYIFAMLLISEGERKMEKSGVPQNFRGLPVRLIYISILALAVYGLTGHSMAL